MYKIKLKKSVAKFLEKRPLNELRIIIDKFELLKQNPYPINNSLDIKKLKGSNEYRLRIGKYRFIYQIKDEILVLVMEKADSRGDIYK